MKQFALEEFVSLFSLFSFSRIKSSFGHCTGGSCESAALSLFHDAKRDTALVGHVFKKISVTDEGACFVHCVDDCWCLSFNYKLRDEKHNCELNEANSHLSPNDLTPTYRVNYYEPSRSYSTEEPADSCTTDSCTNDCCRSNPCLNGGTCKEVCDPKGRRYNCTGCAKRHGGHRCQITLPQTCNDLLSSGVKQNGIHAVYDEQDKPFKVFCDFTPESGAAWTLIMSHTLANNGQFAKTATYLDLTVNENSPEWGAYRLSKSRMMSIRQNSTHWRATCNFPTDGVDFRDYLRASLGDFDIMARPSTDSQCHLYELVNIRGINCTDCTAFTFYSDRIMLHVDSYRSSSRGCMFDGSAGSIHSEDNFGAYKNKNEAFRCSSSSSSTTQYWIGTMC